MQALNHPRRRAGELTRVHVRRGRLAVRANEALAFLQTLSHAPSADQLQLDQVTMCRSTRGWLRDLPRAFLQRRSPSLRPRLESAGSALR